MQRKKRAAALFAAAAVMTGLLAGCGGAPQGAEPQARPRAARVRSGSLSAAK